MIIASALLTAILFANLQAMEQPEFTIDLSKLLIVNAEAPAEKTPPRAKTRPQKGSKVLDSSGEYDFSPIERRKGDINAPDEDGYTQLHRACMCLTEKQYKKKATTRQRYIDSLLNLGAQADKKDSIGLNPRTYFLISLADRKMRDFKDPQNYAAIVATCNALGVTTSSELTAGLDWQKIPGVEKYKDRPLHITSSIEWSPLDYLKYMAAEYKALPELKQLFTTLYGSKIAKELVPEIE